MRGFFVAVIAIGILSGAMFGLSHLSSQNLLTGNFYKMDNTSDLEKEYNSITWNKTSEKDEYARSVYSDSFDNLNITEVSINNKTVNLSSEEVLRLSNPRNGSINITFSESILGITGKNISLNRTSDLKLRLRDNITLKIESTNKTYSKYIRTLIPDRTTSENQTPRTETRDDSNEYQGENETTPIVVNLTNNMSRTITSPNSLKLINNRNYTVKLVSNNSNIINKTEAKIRGNHSLTLNTTDERNIKIKSQNKTRYDISYNKSYKLSDEAKTDKSSIVDPRDTENTTERTGSSDQNATEKNETQINQSNTSASPGRNNSTENRTLKQEHPERGGKWVEINSERLEDFYIFKYEASRKDANSTSEGESSLPYSQRGVRPWNEISHKEALESCDNLGEDYSLPSSKQWQVAALSGRSDKIGNNNIEGNTGSPGNSCETYSDGRTRGLCKTGTGPSRWANSAGAVDMVGNLWEWTSTVYNVSDLELAGKSGYVKGWSKSSSLPKNLTEKNKDAFVDSYFASSSEGTRAVRKGGGLGMNSRSGAFSTLIDRNPDYESSSIGFRCVYAE